MADRYEALSRDEAAALTKNEGVTVRIGDARRKVYRFTGKFVEFENDGRAVWWPALEDFGAVIERRVPEHPHGIVPQEFGSAIRLGNGRRAMRLEPGDLGWAITDRRPDELHEWAYTSEVQALADQHGFTPLEDASAAREEGRRAGIRAVHDSFELPYEAPTREHIRQAFPEAFEGGESDD